jgi:hypothetical protein
MYQQQHGVAAVVPPEAKDGTVAAATRSSRKKGRAAEEVSASTPAQPVPNQEALPTELAAYTVWPAAASSREPGHSGHCVAQCIRS